MKREYKNLIERYFNGEANGQDLVTINHLLLEDEEFRKRFELKKALNDAAQMQDEFVYKNELEMLLKTQQESKRKRTRTIRFISSIAAVLLLTAGLYLFVFKKDKPEQLALNVGYFEMNYDGGSGFSGAQNKAEPVFVKDINVQFFSNINQKDTTYQTASKDTLKIVLPEITSNLKDSKLSVVFDYKLKASLFLIGQDTFLLKKAPQTQKLIKYKK